MDGPNSIEFTMKKKEDVKTAVHRFWIFCACFMTAAAIIAVLAFAVTPAMVVMFTPALLVGAGVAWWYFKRFTRIEYEYVILSGELSVSAIYDNRSRRDLIKGAKISDMHKIVPYHTNEPLLNAPEIREVLYYCSDLANPDLYLAIFDDSKKGRIALVFNTNRKFMQIMKFYNSLNAIVKNDFQF